MLIGDPYLWIVPTYSCLDVCMSAYLRHETHKRLVEAD
jgi:hypothetical protein